MASNQQLGYNHNIPHRGRLYHVQTEDSGPARAHIFTHVFYDGTIVASNRVDYKPQLESENLAAVIIGLMQESHKSMIRQLRSSSFDEKIVRFIGAHPEGSNKPETPAAAAAAGKGPARPSRGPARVGRRMLGGIGGTGVTEGTPIAQRRDIIVGKFASEHQYQLDDEILALLAEEQ